MIYCYACDSDFLPYTIISVVSLLRHNVGVQICVLGDRLSSSDVERLHFNVLKFGGSLLYFDVGEKLDYIRSSGAFGYTSFVTYARIFVGDFLHGYDGRVLYIDSDTMVNSSLTFFDDFDMQGKPLAFAADFMPWAYKKVIGLDKTDLYYNAGVMLIDLARWRSCGLKRLFLSRLSSTSVGVFPDQDIFNRFFRQYIALLPPFCNFLSQYFLFGLLGCQRVCGGVSAMPYFDIDFFKRPLILHFAGNTLGRPWFSLSNHPFKVAYCNVASLCGFSDFVNLDGGVPLIYRFQYFLYQSLPSIPLISFEVVCSWLYRLHVFLRYCV